MSMTTVMVLVESTLEGRRAVEVAFLAARRDRGHVVGLYAIPPSERLTAEKMHFSRTSIGMPGEDVRAMLDMAEQEGGAGAEAARQSFEEVAGRMNAKILEKPPNPGCLTAHFKTLSTGDSDAVAVLGRVFDLVVVRQPIKDPTHWTRKMLRAVLFQAGRPVLVAPPSQVSTLGKRPLIAWNGSALSARAAAIARNFFSGAKEVGILFVRTKDKLAGSAQDLADYIAWYNISASVLEVDLHKDHLGDVFLREAANFSADLLVMGAYSQSPFRESLTGGVTNHVLSQAEIPVLMTH